MPGSEEVGLADLPDDGLGSSGSESSDSPSAIHSHFTRSDDRFPNTPYPPQHEKQPNSSTLDMEQKAPLLIALIGSNALWELSSDARTREFLVSRSIAAAAELSATTTPATAHSSTARALTDRAQKRASRLLGRWRSQVHSMQHDETAGEARPNQAKHDQVQRYPRPPPFWAKYNLTEDWTSSAANHLVAGGIAGAVSRTAVAPLERFKILLQTDTLPLSRSQDLVRSFTTMVRRDGLAGLFRGNGINVLRIVPYSAVQFSSYDVFKKLLVPSTATGLTTERRLAAGALAGMCSVTVTYPLDFLRTRISIAQLGSLPAPLAQLVGNSTIGPLKSSTRTTQTRIVPTALHVIRTEGGVLALYRGMGTSLVGVAPYMSLNLVLYEYLRDRSNAWLRARGTPPPETAAAAAPGAAPLSLTVALTRMLCGATAGGLAQTATYPLELIRRKLQMAMRGTRLRDLCATVWRVDGARGFWKGLTPNLIKVVPAAGVSFMTYEWCKSAFGI